MKAKVSFDANYHYQVTITDNNENDIETYAMLRKEDGVYVIKRSFIHNDGSLQSEIIRHKGKRNCMERLLYIACAVNETGRLTVGMTIGGMDAYNRS